MHRVFSALLWVSAAACGCDCESNITDPNAVLVRREHGGFVLDVRVDGAATTRTALIDVLSPLTVLDQDAAAPPTRRHVDLDMLAPRSETDPTPIVRASWCAEALDMHPCAPGEVCGIGDRVTPLPIGAVIGGDLLRQRAVRFEPADDRIYFLPDVAGGEEERSRTCDVVVPEPFYGGGTLRVGDTEVGFAGTRIALSVCLSPNPGAPDPAERGTDAALVMSTGIGTSIIGEQRYTAWASVTGATPYAELESGYVRLPSGIVEGRAAQIDRLAIVGSPSSPQGCRAVYAHHLLAERDCVPGDDCPCADDSDFCSIGAVLELTPAAPIDVVVVPDDHPLLQALRAELRPEQPEVDGILGVDALAGTAFDVDYPNNRLLFRCVDAGCVPRTKLFNVDSRGDIARCIAAAPTL